MAETIFTPPTPTSPPDPVVMPEPEPDTYICSHTCMKMCLIKQETLNPKLTKFQAKAVKMLPSSTLLFFYFFDEGKSDASFPLPRGNQVASQPQKT